LAEKMADAKEADTEMTTKEAPAEAKKEPKAAPEPPKELEEDAKEDKGPKIAEEIGFNMEDTTLNVMPSTTGNLLMTLTDGGMQFLLAGARANCGLKAGRYLFEVKMASILDLSETQGSGRQIMPKHVLKIGFSTAGSSLFLGDSEESVCFDSEGKFTAARKASFATSKFQRDQVLGVLLNLDDSSPNANTVSLFRDGVRACQPQPLPEHLQGKTLFPTLTFRNVTVNYNFGKVARFDLPFKCNMIGAAAKKDAEITKAIVAKEGKYDVIFPVCVPDQGTFDWLEMFLEKNPHYTELSDRMILEWCEKSGIPRNGGYKRRSCNDKPEMSFGIPELENQSVRRMIRNIAAEQKRNYVVMEVKSNLVAAERKELASRFYAPHFKKTAQVLMGEPKEDFKKKSHALLLKVKQEKADLEFKKQKAEEARKRLQEKQKKELEKVRKKAERAAKKAKLEAEKKEGEEVKEDEEEEEEQEDEAMPEAEDPPAVTLTAEEKKQAFRPLEIPDLQPAEMSTGLNSFSLPEKSEGFEEVTFGWSPKAKAEPYFKDWKLKCKLTTRVEDITPSEWFVKQNAAWTQQLTTWKSKVQQWKAEQLKKDKAVMKVGEVKEGEETKEEVKEEEKKDVPMISVSDADLDIFGLENVNDIGTGEPLCSMFGFEDWALLSLRVELHLLAHSFRKDVKDDERPGITADHLSFYFNKYFRKAFIVGNYGVDSVEKLVDLVQDTVSIDDKKVLVAELDEERESLDLFLKLTEEGRKRRELLIDSGDESAILKFNQSALNASSNGSQKKSGGDKGGKGWQQPQDKGAGKGWQQPQAQKGWTPKGMGKGGPQFGGGKGKRPFGK